jgi:hypothetical protein
MAMFRVVIGKYLGWILEFPTTWFSKAPFQGFLPDFDGSK